MQRDFIGFSFNGVHSSALGIVRVSDGDRYTETLQPEFEDKQEGVSGHDGEYYFGSSTQSKSIKISIAFDSVTESQFRLIGYLFSTKKPCSLIFDERPYKMYTAKIASPIEISYVCFDEPLKTIGGPRDGLRVAERTINEEEISIIREQVYPYIIDSTQTQRIYKGEADIEFICTYPYARAPFKTLDDYRESSPNTNLITSYSNVDEWKDASGILTRAEYEAYGLDQLVWHSTPRLSSTYVYNPGDISTPFCLYFPYYTTQDGRKIIQGVDTNQFYIRLGDEFLFINKITRKNDGAGEIGEFETGIMINTANHLIEGVIYQKGGPKETWTTTGNIYNNRIVKGDFPKILPIGEHELIENNPLLMKQELSTNCLSTAAESRLIYDYLYY